MLRRQKRLPGGWQALPGGAAGRAITAQVCMMQKPWKYSFPGGMLPSPIALRREIARAGLTLAGSTEFGQSHSPTLRRWHDTFNARWGEIAHMGFDAGFRRMWNFYLASCAGAFHGGNCDVSQITVTRPAA